MKAASFAVRSPPRRPLRHGRMTGRSPPARTFALCLSCRFLTRLMLNGVILKTLSLSYHFKRDVCVRWGSFGMKNKCFIWDGAKLEGCMRASQQTSVCFLERKMSSEINRKYWTRSRKFEVRLRRLGNHSFVWILSWAEVEDEEVWSTFEALRVSVSLPFLCSFFRRYTEDLSYNWKFKRVLSFYESKASCVKTSHFLLLKFVCGNRSGLSVSMPSVVVSSWPSLVDTFVRM